MHDNVIIMNLDSAADALMCIYECPLEHQDTSPV